MVATASSTMPVPRFVGDSRIDYVDKPVPEVGEGELLIEVRANLLCGSERPLFQYGWEVTPGHEVAGEVAQAGPGTRTAPGTRGAVFLMDFCGECRSCKVGATNQCLDKRGDVGFTVDGGYAPYVRVHETAFFPTGDVEGADATLLLDIMGTGGHAIKRAQLLRDDIESVLVVGAGPIGLAVLAMTRIMLGEDVPIAITDLSPYRLELAERMGGVPIDVSGGELADLLAEREIAAPDVAFDSSGRTGARVSALDALAKRGVLVCVGHGGKAPIEVSRQLIEPERAVLGSEYFRYDEMAGNLALLHEHHDYLSQIITHRFGVDRLQEAFELFLAGETAKVAIEQ